MTTPRAASALATRLVAVVRRRDQAGQTTIEFVGGLIVVCAIVGALVVGLVPEVRQHVRTLGDKALTAMREGPG